MTRRRGVAASDDDALRQLADSFAPSPERERGGPDTLAL